MRTRCLFLALGAFCLLCGVAPRLSAQTAGIPAEWDTRTMLQSLAEQSLRLQPVLAKVQPQTWIAQGAPDAYIAQWQRATSEIGHLATSSQILAQQPEKLTAALDTLYRLENLETLIRSLANGIRKYQDAALADNLQVAMSQNFSNREKLRQYVLDLAGQKEQEYQAADKEVQRCRTEILRQPVHPPAARSRLLEKK